jgi:hypothetical protein
MQKSYLIYSKINVNSTIMTMIFYSSGMKRPKIFLTFQNGDVLSDPKNGDRLSQNGQGQNILGTHNPRDE